jgi:hypothetical protein
MKPTQRIHDPFHNPFHNRFHVPVHSRLDEMQAFTQMAWLNESAASRPQSENEHQSRYWRIALAILALLVVVVFSGVMLSH